MCRGGGREVGRHSRAGRQVRRGCRHKAGGGIGRVVGSEAADGRWGEGVR